MDKGMKSVICGVIALFRQVFPFQWNIVSWLKVLNNRSWSWDKLKAAVAN